MKRVISEFDEKIVEKKENIRKTNYESSILRRLDAIELTQMEDMRFNANSLVSVLQMILSTLPAFQSIIDAIESITRVLPHTLEGRNLKQEVLSLKKALDEQSDRVSETLEPIKALYDKIEKDKEKPVDYIR